MIVGIGVLIISIAMVWAGLKDKHPIQLFIDMAQGKSPI